MSPTRRALFTGRVATEAPVAITSRCLAHRGVHCQSCGDACSALAIRFAHRIGGPPLPVILADRCTACGDCIAMCPGDAVVRVSRSERG